MKTNGKIRKKIILSTESGDSISNPMQSYNYLRTLKGGDGNTQPGMRLYLRMTYPASYNHTVVSQP